MPKNTDTNKNITTQNHVNNYASPTQKQVLEKVEEINNRFSKALKGLAQNKEKLWEHARNNNTYNNKEQCLITKEDDDFYDDGWDTN